VFLIYDDEFEDHTHAVQSGGSGEFKLAVGSCDMFIPVEALPEIDPVAAVRGDKIAYSEPRSIIMPLPRLFD
jgi:hypothetical protein